MNPTWTGFWKSQAVAGEIGGFGAGFERFWSKLAKKTEIHTSYQTDPVLLVIALIPFGIIWRAFSIKPITGALPPV